MPTNARKDNIHVCAEKSLCSAELSMKIFYTIGASLFPRMDGLLKTCLYYYYYYYFVYSLFILELTTFRRAAKTK